MRPQWKARPWLFLLLEWFDEFLAALNRELNAIFVALPCWLGRSGFLLAAG